MIDEDFVLIPMITHYKENRLTNSKFSKPKHIHNKGQYFGTIVAALPTILHLDLQGLWVLYVGDRVLLQDNEVGF